MAAVGTDDQFIEHTTALALEEKSKLVKSLIVEGAKFRGQPTKRPDKSEMPGDLVNDETEPKLLRKR